MSDRITIVQPGPLSAVARGIRARLEQVFPPAQFAHLWMPSRPDSAAWSRLTRRPPVIALGFNEFTTAAESHATGASEWTLYLVTGNEAGDEARLFGDRHAPGLLGLIEVGVAALHGLNIVGSGSVRVGQATHAFVETLQDASLAIATIDLAAATTINLGDVIIGGDAEPGLGRTQDVTWNFEAPGVIAGSHTGTP